MNNRQKRSLLEKINKLTYTEHDEIFKLLRNNSTPFTQNKNGVFFNLSSVDEKMLMQIDQFVDFCLKNKKELDEYDKKINECKISNKYDRIIFDNPQKSENRSLASLLTASKKEDWQTVMNDIKSSEKLSNFVEMLETNMDKIHKKKINTKFVNAKKRYARKLVTEKKFESELTNNLEEEAYPIASI